MKDVFYIKVPETEYEKMDYVVETLKTMANKHEGSKFLISPFDNKGVNYAAACLLNSNYYEKGFDHFWDLEKEYYEERVKEEIEDAGCDLLPISVWEGIVTYLIDNYHDQVYGI